MSSTSTVALVSIVLQGPGEPRALGDPLAKQFAFKEVVDTDGKVVRMPRMLYPSARMAVLSITRVGSSDGCGRIESAP